MAKINKRGATLVELVIVIAIIAVLTFGALKGMEVLKNSKDLGVQKDLETLSKATQLLMAANDNIAPCFTPEVQEGTDSGDSEYTNSICANSGYDYIQGQGTDETDTSLDEDGKTGELFTFNNVLLPKYLDKMPLPRIGGQPYVYTKGISTTEEGASAFAYTGVLAGSKAAKAVRDNVSVLNVAITDAGAKNSTNLNVCPKSYINFKGNGTQLTPLAGGTNNDDLSLVYYAYDSLKDGYVKNLVGDWSDRDNSCDVYSDGLSINSGNFSDDQGAADQSVTITVNAR